MLHSQLILDLVMVVLVVLVLVEIMEMVDFLYLEIPELQVLAEIREHPQMLLVLHGLVERVEMLETVDNQEMLVLLEMVVDL